MYWDGNFHKCCSKHWPLGVTSRHTKPIVQSSWMCAIMVLLLEIIASLTLHLSFTNTSQLANLYGGGPAHRWSYRQQNETSIYPIINALKQTPCTQTHAHTHPHTCTASVRRRSSVETLRLLRMCGCLCNGVDWWLNRYLLLYRFYFSIILPLVQIRL